MLVNIINVQVQTEQVGLFVVNDFVDEELLDSLSPQCRIVRVNRRPGSRNFLKILTLNVRLWQFHPDIVHLHSYQVSDILFGRWNMVRTIHNPGNKTTEYRKMKALYAISDIVRNDVAMKGFPNVTTVNNGIVVGRFKGRTGGKPQNGIYKMVVTSRLHIEQKGQDILLKALSRLSKRGITNFELDLIGEGASEGVLKEMAGQLALGDKVRFLGLRSQTFLCQHLCDYDLFVQPSRFDGFGLTVAEAMAARLPVLVSDIQGPMEVIGYGQFGMSFKAGDDSDLAEKLEAILAGGYDYTLIGKAYRHVGKEYDVALTAQRYLQEYQKVTG